MRYVYDGNVVVQEQDQNNAPKVSYTRGTDLSGTIQGAGGIGGLLARTDNSLGTSAYYFADGNGNITCMLDGNQAVAASYLYDPYGRILSQSGWLANANLYRFSSKESQINSGLVYYGYRLYDPNLQRWPNKDPIEDRAFAEGPTKSPGGAGDDLNLYRFAGNSPAAHYDSLGLVVATANPCGNDPDKCMICMAWAEARPNLACMKAVAQVIWNRSQQQNKSMCEIVAAPNQFDAYNPRPNRNGNLNNGYAECCHDNPSGPSESRKLDKFLDQSQDWSEEFGGDAGLQLGGATYFNSSPGFPKGWGDPGNYQREPVPGCPSMKFYTKIR